ncbi:MAG: hypothetical protein GEU74_04115 [Nitriliruptorales bacterium]|nr:hypothetical protein [Nitriliruptorales bacterium]
MAGGLPCAGWQRLLEEAGYAHIAIGPAVDTFAGAQGERNARRFSTFGHAFLAVKVAHFDAGDRGCGDGLAGEFRRHIDAVAVGEQLRVTVRDPAAKADIPPVARMLGHRVLSEEPLNDGRLVITVERGHERKADL